MPLQFKYGPRCNKHFDPKADQSNEIHHPRNSTHFKTERSRHCPQTAREIPALATTVYVQRHAIEGDSVTDGKE